MWVSVALVNLTDLGLIDMFLINLNSEIVACMLSFRKSRHKPNLESTSKYGFSPDLGGKMALNEICRLWKDTDFTVSLNQSFKDFATSFCVIS